MSRSKQNSQIHKEKGKCNTSSGDKNKNTQMLKYKTTQSGSISSYVGISKWRLQNNYYK